MMIPRLDITKVSAKEASKKKATLILTTEGDLNKNLMKSRFKILKNKIKYSRFSNDVIIPNALGASINKGRNQNVKNLNGKG